MDPNANLAEQLRLANRVLTDDMPDERRREAAHRLAELVEALDEWVRRGGALPTAWTTGRGQGIRF